MLSFPVYRESITTGHIFLTGDFSANGGMAGVFIIVKGQEETSQVRERDDA